MTLGKYFRMSLLSVGFAMPALTQAGPTMAEFHDAMRKLWEDHVTWTRLYIVSALNDLPNKDATAKRLLRNQDDIGDAIRPYYGGAAGDKLTALLKDHIVIATEIIDAAKKGDKAKQTAASKRWDDNADAIAVFLSGANPKNWPEKHMKSMMKEHLGTTTTEVVAHLKKDWAADVKAYDKVHDVILEMADMLSAGIVKQFPDKFKK